MGATVEQSLANTIALLSRTPAALNALLRDLPNAWTQSNEGGKSWSPYEIVAHLARTEKHDWIPRLKTMLRAGASIPTLESVIRQPDAQQRSLSELLDEFARLREENLRELQTMNLQPADLVRPGNHRSLGPVNVSQLLATWTTHDLTDLHQLSRVLAYQYRDAVGAWSAFLGVLKCDAHSAPA